MSSGQRHSLLNNPTCLITCPGVLVCIQSLRGLLRTPGLTLPDLRDVQDSDPCGGPEEQTEVQQRHSECCDYSEKRGLCEGELVSTWWRVQV